MLRNKITTAVRNAKRIFFIEGARKGTKQFWKNIKFCTGFGKAKTFRTPWPCANKESSTGSANMINKHFIDSISAIIKNISDAVKTTVSVICSNASNCFSFSKITNADVESAIVSLSDTASTRSHNISSKMLKLSHHAISPILVEIFNHSIMTSTFPDQWKLTVVVPIFKKGEVNNINNYRQLALLSVLSKVFEKVIAKQLLEHLDKTCSLSPSQFSYRQGFSTESALLRLFKLLFSARQTSMYTSVTTIDFSKAFECLNHSLLMDKLHQHGLSNSTVQWFTSYLADRLQKVRYGGVLSEPMNVSLGVSEGSIQGPHLFNMYINSLLQSLLPDSAVAYADDVTLIAQGKTAAEATRNMQDLLCVINT